MKYSINVIDKRDVLDSNIIRMPKTYPAYFGAYYDFNLIREFAYQIENLFQIVRNDIHK